MSGRYRALLVAVASSGSLLFAWIGAAIVALVTLRKGVGEGGWLLLWAMLPALILTRITGDSSALALLLGTALLALLLRLTVSLSLAALGSAGVAVLTGVGLLFFAQGLLDELARVFEEFFRALETQAQQSGDTELALRPPTRLQLAGMMGTANGALSFLCLSLARYWQAALYNPGGFGAEFRALRLPPGLVLALAVAGFGLAWSDFSYRSWGAALMLPLTVAGFALLHARVRLKGQGSLWLSTLYLLWLVFDAAKLALIGLVIADAVLDFRARWQAAGPGDSDRSGGPPSAPPGNGDAQGPRDDDRDGRQDDE
jgi:hypothetical protein